MSRTSQRGSVVLYLLFSIVLASAAGFATYRYMRDHKSTEPEVDEAAAPTVKPKALPPAPPAVVTEDPIVPHVVPPEVVEAQPSLAEQTAVDPADNDDFETPSPAFGVAGIDGGIERTSVDRRFRARAPLIQRCYERSGASPGVVRVTIVVEKNGKITSVKLNSGDDGFQACVMTLINQMSFSATHDGKTATIVQPIRFH